MRIMIGIYLVESFNHESEFRGSEYLIMKIINGAIDIKNQEKNIQLGSLELKETGHMLK